MKDLLPNATAFPHCAANHNVGVLLAIGTNVSDPQATFQGESALVNAWWPRAK